MSALSLFKDAMANSRHLARFLGCCCCRRFASTADGHSLNFRTNLSFLACIMLPVKDAIANSRRLALFLGCCHRLGARQHPKMRSILRVMPKEKMFAIVNLINISKNVRVSPRWAPAAIKGMKNQWHQRQLPTASSCQGGTVSGQDAASFVVQRRNDASATQIR
jgi:hypothetical protein